MALVLRLCIPGLIAIKWSLKTRCEFSHLPRLCLSVLKTSISYVSRPHQGMHSSLERLTWLPGADVCISSGPLANLNISSVHHFFATLLYRRVYPFDPLSLLYVIEKPSKSMYWRLSTVVGRHSSMPDAFSSSILLRSTFGGSLNYRTRPNSRYCLLVGT